MVMLQKDVSAVALLFMLFFGACTGEESTNLSLADLEGVWLLTALSVDGNPVALDQFSTNSYPDFPAWFELSVDKGVRGEGPCNGFRGTANIGSGEIRPDEMVSQAVLCEEAEGFESVLQRLWSSPVIHIVPVDDGGTVTEWSTQTLLAIFERDT
jgi:heat shock protein HslJ